MGIHGMVCCRVRVMLLQEATNLFLRRHLLCTLIWAVYTHGALLSWGVQQLHRGAANPLLASG